MSVLFLTNSLSSTVQDLGRTRFRRFGINPNGAMDQTAARLINILLGNAENEALLEMHFPAPKILFEENAVIALGGASFGTMVNEKKIENWRPVSVEKGSELSFPAKIFGNRAYLAVKGGFKIENWLESASTNLKAKIGGFEGRSLQKGDRLFLKQRTKVKGQNTNVRISKSLIPRYSSFPAVRVTAGTEFEKLTGAVKKNFPSQIFTIRHESDRMGFRLHGENLNLRAKLELVSSAVSFGTIQLLPDGQLIILMADHQTTGGYPRLAHVFSGDLPLVAQLGANDKLSFSIISLEEAENLTLLFEKDLNMLKTACRFLW